MPAPYPRCPVPATINARHDGGAQAGNGPLYYPLDAADLPARERATQAVPSPFTCAACFAALGKRRGARATF
jgi:hypothetical protein